MTRILKRRAGAGSFDPIWTETEAYADGKKNGLAWTAPWVPGGPFVCKPSLSREPMWIAYCEATRRNNEEWLRGWKDGVAAKEKE